MLLSALSKFLSGMVLLVLLSVVASWVISQTLMSSAYVKGELQAVDAYVRLSKALSDQIVTEANMTDPQIAAEVQKVISPQELQSRIEPTLDQLEAYFKGEGQPPTIDVSDLLTDVQAAGVPIDAANSEAAKPIELFPDAEQAPPTKNIAGVKTAAVLLLIALVAILAVISWKTKRYKILPNTAIACSIPLAIIAAVLLLARGTLEKLIKTDDEKASAFASIAQDLAGNISHDIGVRYAVIAAILLVAGIAARIFIARTTAPATKKK